jgi:hypothetical protein
MMLSRLDVDDGRWNSKQQFSLSANLASLYIRNRSQDYNNVLKICLN